MSKSNVTAEHQYETNAVQMCKHQDLIESLHCRIQISAQKTFHCNRIIIVDSLLLSISGTSGTSSTSSTSSTWAVASVIEAVVLAVRVAVVVVVVVEAVVVVVVMTVVTAVLVVVVVVDVAAVVVVAAVVALAAGTAAAAASGSITFLCDFGVGDSDSGGVTVVFRSIIRDGHCAGECNEGKKPNYEKLGHG